MTEMKRARVDEENGCEACWSEARAAGVVDVEGDALRVLAPDEWIGRPCPHDASECAPSILLPDDGEVYRVWQDGIVQELDATEERAATTEARDWVEGGDYDRSGETYWVHATLQRSEDGGASWKDVRSLRVAIEPEEPECSSDGHDWEDDGAEGFGSVVRGNGGGVICRYRCPHCGWRRVEDSWAQDRETGEQGLHSTRYEEGEPEVETDEEDA